MYYNLAKHLQKANVLDQDVPLVYPDLWALSIPWRSTGLRECCKACWLFTCIGHQDCPPHRQREYRGATDYLGLSYCPQRKSERNQTVPRIPITKDYGRRPFLGDPIPPPGFRLDPVFWEPQIYQYDVRELWLGIANEAAHIAQNPGNEPVTTVEVFHLVISNAAIHLFGRDHMLTHNTLVWTLWEIGRQMALLYPFPQRISFFDGLIKTSAGTVGHFRGIPPTLAIFRSSNSSDGAITARRRRDNSANLVARANQGSRPCREDPDLVVHYQYLGQHLPPGDTFTAFLKAQVFFSENDADRADVSILALGTNRRVRLAVRRDATGAGEVGLKWKHAWMAVRTVWTELMIGYSYDAKGYVNPMRLESLSFILRYKNVVAGRGSLSL
ncbi:MAG: hypothetical protein LQ350_002869 [Teloschistes chrysophthalmus]|nr:MAG: hypothetical protein LQ350_002869 [Niorma chrysophthalma]